MTRKQFTKTPSFELHEHSCLTSGPAVVHSHERGDEPHQHPGYGPASYVIDKAEWAARTGGIKGGAAKKFSARPCGRQMPWQELEDWQKSFEVIVCDSPAEYRGEGGGVPAAARMISQFRLTARVVDARRKAL